MNYVYYEKGDRIYIICDCGSKDSYANKNIFELRDGKLYSKTESKGRKGWNVDICSGCKTVVPYIETICPPHLLKLVEEDIKLLQYTPRCPTCACEILERISGSEKVGSALLFGLYSASKQGKQFRCKACGYEW